MRLERLGLCMLIALALIAIALLFVDNPKTISLISSTDVSD